MKSSQCLGGYCAAAVDRTRMGLMPLSVLLLLKHIEFSRDLG